MSPDADHHVDISAAGTAQGQGIAITDSTGALRGYQEIHGTAGIEVELAFIADHVAGTGAQQGRVDRIGADAGDHDLVARAQGNGVVATGLAQECRLPD